MTKVIKLLFPFVAVILPCLTVSAQDMISPLHSNQAIKSYLKEHQKANPTTGKRIDITSDTLELPFIDDFSYDGIYPNQNLWTDSNVFINRDFPVDPPTIGVATFDGLNKYGNPYNPGGTNDSIADYLTSRYIRDTIINDTTVWLSFFIQPWGRGYPPDPIDSLRLEFQRSTDTAWTFIWDTAGGPLAPFHEVMIHIDTSYSNGAFRFRFSNIANVNGNVDHWHLDYVKLDRGRNANDTGFIDETTFIYRNKSLLAPPFTSMPYSHYKTNPSQYTVTSEYSLYKNLTSQGYSFNHDFRVIRDDGSVAYTAGITGTNVNPFSIDSTPKPVNYVFPSLPQSSLRYSTLNINTSPHGIQRNDSVLEPQVLDNYYSYDDGTAEVAYGITGAGGEIAYQFDLKMQDTLRGVQIYWDQKGPDVHNFLLSITVWDQIILNTDNDHQLYKLVDTVPVNDSMINGFVTYIFDTAKIVSGTIYIGWIQDDEQILNIGFDRNTDTHDKIYFNVLGVWQQGNYSGSMMMRPIFGSALNAGVNNLNQASLSASAYPNPVDKQLTIQSSMFRFGGTTLALYNTLGERIFIHHVGTLAGAAEVNVNVANLENGFYILRITDDKSGQFVTNKVLITHP